MTLVCGDSRPRLSGRAIILQNYERIDEEIKADLPMKKIWVMVKDEIE